MVTSSAHSRSLPTGTPMAMRVTRTPSGFSEPRQVDGGRLALDGRARGEDHLLDAAGADALEEARQAQLVGADARERRERSVQHVVAALEVARLLDRDDVVRLLDHADRPRAARGSEQCWQSSRSVTAWQTEQVRIPSSSVAIASPRRAASSSRAAQQVERDALGRLRPDARELPQLVDQPLDRGRVVHSHPRQLQAAGERPHLLLDRGLHLARGLVDGGRAPGPAASRRRRLFTTSGSILRLLSCFWPSISTFTTPPPELASTTIAAISACRRSCACCSCFIILRGSPNGFTRPPFRASPRARRPRARRRGRAPPARPAPSPPPRAASACGRASGEAAAARGRRGRLPGRELDRETFRPAAFAASAS